MTETTPTTVRAARTLRLHLLEITPKAGGETTTRLVRAKTDRGATAHVSDSTITCRLATPEDAYELAKAGVEIETAGEEKPEAAGE